jgi:hypothetical protein
MVVTNIVPCIKVTKESNMSGVDMYLEIGDHIKVIDNEDNIFLGRLSFIELGIDEDEDDVIHITLDNDKVVSIEVSKINDLDYCKCE